MRSLQLSLVLMLPTVLACSSGGDPFPCEGECATLVAKVTLIDTTGAPLTCEAAGVDEVVLTLSGQAGALGMRTADCGEAVELGPLTLGSYEVSAVARDTNHVEMGKDLRSAALFKDGDRADVEIQIVPGPQSQLGQACTGACPDGYSCVQVDFGGTKTSFCTPECGMASATQAPPQGDLVCRRGWVGTGIPRCMLYGDGPGVVSWSCLLGCDSDGACPTGMSCYKPQGGQAVCINP